MPASVNRTQLVESLFPSGLPRLWCPTLTHFSARHRLDAARIQRHLQLISPWVKGLLVPGSTGEGWELNDDEAVELLNLVLSSAKALHMRVLIGVLKIDLPSMLKTIDKLLSHNPGNVVGFTVCPPKGKHLSQPEIIHEVSQLLDRHLPTALYQLPQVTENEMTPETIQTLARLYPNFYLFKDSSGLDRVAQSSLDLQGLVLVRGAEGHYVQWPKTAGGPYDGFLLSTANVFARELHAILDFLDEGNTAEATKLSQRLTAVVNACFLLVGGFPAGNPFTNTNKILDHIMAYGPFALKKDPPLLYSGLPLPKRFIEQAIDLLRQNSLMPAKGYYE